MHLLLPLNNEATMLLLLYRTKDNFLHSLGPRYTNERIAEEVIVLIIVVADLGGGGET